MTRTYPLFSAGMMCHALLLAQTQPGVMPFQPAQSLAAGPGGHGLIVAIPRPETGKPFSATVNTQSIKTFLDGTHVSQITTMVEYRDAEGRVRTEISQPGTSVQIQIHDPVAGVIYRLDPANKSALKKPAVAATQPAGGRGGRNGGSPLLPQQRPGAMDRLKALAAAVKDSQEAPSGPNTMVEDLGAAMINGVPARGTRTTTIVPVGSIGNDREFRSVDERWFSPDLNMLIKSVNTDPRFGTTTYEVTNINRRPPDPSLFQVPADYTVLSNSPSTGLIEGIEFHGAGSILQSTLPRTIFTRTGDVYDEETVRRDVSALWNTNRFTDIQLRKETGSRGGIVLHFFLTERP